MKESQLAEFQNRVFVWQRDVAGQPVTLRPEECNEAFYPKQLSFVESEWFDEYIPNSAEYLQAMANYTSGLSKQITLIPESIKSLRIQVADDIGDTAFTLLGLSNVIGEDIGPFGPGITLARFGLSAYERGVSSAIRSLRHRCDDNWPEIVRALASLYGVSIRHGINFYAALKAVCDSNDTKLWTRDEVDNSMTALNATIVPGRGASQRIYRVTNADGKLIKSPSFEPPNLEAAVAN